MKVSNETKVGALAAVAIVFLVLGYNFLRGRTLFKTGNFLYAKFTDTKGLMVSNGVFVNGSAANWPPYYCTLFLREINVLEIKFWNFLGPESTSILYKRMKSD